MKIDVHNYEEFLLLYIDGELNATEMHEIENFAKEYPFVQAELNALQATKLMPEEVLFTNKASLFKTPQPQEITTANYQEKLLMYVDEELNTSEKAEVEKFVLHNPHLQNEFVALKQTKLPQEIVICPNKEDLYKKENKRAVIFYLSRVAVAAVFVGLIGFAYTLISKKDTTEGNNTAKTESPNTYKEETKLPSETVKTDTPTKEIITKNDVVNTTPTINNSKQNQKISPMGVEPKNTPSAPIVPNNVIVNNNNSTAVNVPKKQEVVDVMAIPSSNNTNNNGIETPENNVVKNNALTVNNVENTNSQTTFTQTVYKNIDVENEESNAILVGNMRLNKAKVQNLFKKVGKIFGKSKKAQMEEDENSKKAVAST